jgi:hypothetical protein
VCSDCHPGEVWDLLTWRSPHPHAPVTVAASPHYWAQLDVAATVHSLLQYCPRFWHSDELHQTLRNGQLVLLDGSFFAQELLGLLQAGTGSKSGGKGAPHGSRGDGSRDRRDGGSRDRHGSSRDSDRDRDRRAAERLLADLDGWLASTPHMLVCRRLMHLLPEPALVSAFRQTVMKQAGAGGGGRSHAAAEATARRLVFGTQWHSLGDLLLAHAMTFRAVELWRWMQEDSASLQVPQQLQGKVIDMRHLWPSYHRQTLDINNMLGTKDDDPTRLHECDAGCRACFASAAGSKCSDSTMGCAAPRC